MLTSWRGSAVAIDGPEPLLARLKRQLPPFYGSEGTAGVTATMTQDDQTITLHLEEGLSVSGPDSDEIFRAAASRVELALVDRLQGLVAVHAGVVATDRGVILLPGRSLAGKSTLTQELLSQGATYLSDEFALITSEGKVLPYPRAMTIRTSTGSVRHVPDHAAKPDDEARHPAVVAHLQFDQKGWETRDLTPGEATMALIDNCVNVRRTPAAALTALTALAETATAISGTRGEAPEAARHLLSL